MTKIISISSGTALSKHDLHLYFVSVLLMRFKLVQLLLQSCLDGCCCVVKVADCRYLDAFQLVTKLLCAACLESLCKAQVSSIAFCLKA